MDLTLNQTRLIGCLIEKEITTPDQYPLSLNALTLACNQKSNRDPVLELCESQVQQVIDQLVEKRLLTEVSGFGSRVVKYKHRFCNTEFGELKLRSQELAIIAVLFLRGPQTPGELRSRTHRLCRFTDVHEVDAALQLLTEREEGPFVACLVRDPGKRESRYCHLFSGAPSQDALNGAAPQIDQPEGQGAGALAATVEHSSANSGAADQRLAALEIEVADLRQQLHVMKAQLDELFE
jgi:uncharacterized protein YceH (UPF0502 family)